MNNEIHPADQDLNDQEETSATMLEQLEEYLTEGEYDYQLPEQGHIQIGVVIEIGDRGAIVDAGFKRDGIVPASDLDRLDEETLQSIQPGDEIAVAVQKPEDEEGRLILSIYDALVREDWERAEEMMGAGKLYEGEVSGYNRGGLLVPFGRIRGFIPASHTVGMPRGLQGDERRERLAEMVGDKVGLKIIEVDRHRRRLIFSQRQARRAWQKMQRERVMQELTEGETVTGKVTGITDFGAFVDLGGADGLIHISELSWGQVDDPREVVEVGDEVEVYVLNLDWERTRIALSLKRLQPNPWSQVADQYEVDELVEGKVTRVLDFGAFVELGLGVEGLLHISEMTGTSQLSPTEILKQGQKVLVKIIGIDAHKQRITLSARQVQREQWERWMAEHKITLEEAEEAAPEEAPEPEVVEEEIPEPEAVEEEAPEPEVVEEEIPEPEAVEEEAPEPEAVEGEAPEPEAVEQEAPEPEAVEQEAPEPEAVEGEAPEPEAVEGEAPEPEAVEGEAPEPEAVEGEAPEPEAVEGEAPEPEAVEGEAPEPEAVEGEAPEPEAVEQEIPEPEAVEGEAPEPEAVEGEAPEPEAVEGEAPEPEAVEERAEEIGEPETGEEAEIEAEPSAPEEEEEEPTG